MKWDDMRAGELLVKRFRVERHAGAGAMGTVFRACDLDHGGRLVAIKALPAHLALARFEHEVEALAGLEHDAVVRYVSHGKSEAGEAFVAMEWIEGPALSERLAVSGLSGFDTALLGQRLASGLRALHAQGIVHRDLKPSNIMLPGGRVAEARIVDLGIARLPSAQSEVTDTGSHLGTPRYMAPEQIRDPHGVDGRADLFSLGCVLYECLTCLPAFPGEETVAVLAQVLFGHAPEASEQRPELPEELDRLLERLLSRSRRLRPSAVELEDELAALLRSPLRERLESLGPLAPRRSRRSEPLDRTLASETAIDGSHERPSVALLLTRVSRVDLPGPRRGLPPPRGTWIGRTAELSATIALVEGERVATIWGGAGVGKTRLALEVARHFATRRNQHPPLFCELGEARDSSDIVRLVSERAGFPASAHADPELVLGGLLGKLGEVLLVLDRCEHLALEIAPLLRLWAAHAPGLMLLATSRSRLRGTSELELRPLATLGSRAQPGDLAAPLSEAAELVLARAGVAVAVGAPVTAQTRACAEQIAQALDGNPLAIELAAARVPVLGLAGIVARLPAQLALLSADSGNTMRAAIAWSWDLLDEAERMAFMQCAVFRGSFTLAAAERVIVGPPGAPPVLELVQALREQSLLISAPLAGSSSLEVRLSMSAALREFASTQLTIAEAHRPELAEVHARHARHYEQLARRWIEPSTSASPGRFGRGGAVPSVPAQRRLEHDNLLAATEWSLAQDRPGDAASLVFVLQPALLAGGLASPLAALLDRVLAACEAAPERVSPRMRVRLRGLRARLMAPAGELARAKAELERVRVEAAALGDDALLGITWLDLGVVHHFAHELESALQCYTNALQLLSNADDVFGESRCHGNLGAVAHDQGRLHDAARAYRHAIALLPDGSEPRLLANLQGNLGLLEHELGQQDEARRLYAAAASGLEDACDPRLLGIVLGNWGTLELAAGREDRPFALFERAHALLDGCGDRRSLGLACGRLAVVHARRGRLEEAERDLVRAERMLRRDPLSRVVAACFRAFAELARARGAARAEDTALASSQYERARELAAACQRAEHAGRPVREQSDDLRLYGGLLAQELEQLRGSIHADDQIAG